MKTRPTSAAPANPSDVSPSLAVSGLLMIGVTLLIANPSFGLFRQWPWTLIATDVSPLTQRVVFGLWGVTGVWFLLLSFTRAAALRSGLGLALCGVLALAMLGLGPLEFRIKRYYLNEYLPLIAMGAGLLLWLDPRTARQGRWLAFAGSVTFLCANGVAMEVLEDGVVQPRLVSLWQDFRAELAGTALVVPDQAPLWITILPRGLLMVAATGATLCGLSGFAPRKVLFGLLGILALAVISPVLARPILALIAFTPDVRGLAQQVSYAATEDGLLLWVLSVLTLAEFVRVRTPTEAVAA